MEIDTSTEAGKDEKLASLYLARSKGKIIQHRDAIGKWFDNTSNLTLSYSFRIKPQTVEDAANQAANEKLMETRSEHHYYVDGFKAGAKWKENQSK